MQISRHWRMNAQRYRLEGFQYEDGETSLQPRHIIRDDESLENVQDTNVVTVNSELRAEKANVA